MNLEAYLAGPFNKIQGWCDRALWQTIEPILAFQAELGVKRPVAEIGVNHGKLFIGLVIAKYHPAGNLAIDVFADQAFNLDKSGKGNREAFDANLARCGIPADQIDIRQVDSSVLTDAEVAAIREQSGGFSLFSVDGSHLPEHAYNDISIAMRLTDPGGVILIDDYLAPDWPGVGEAVARHYLLGAPMFVPFAYTCNKLLLCHLRHRGDYVVALRDHFREHRLRARIKKVTRFGYPALTIHPVPADGDVSVEATA